MGLFVNGNAGQVCSKYALGLKWKMVKIRRKKCAVVW
jgi:hypothetical protein